MTVKVESVMSVPGEGTHRDLEGLIFLMDVDGVLTDERARIPVEIVQRLCGLVERGVRVAFVSGRSTRWLEEHLIAALRSAAEATASAPAGSMAFAAEMGAMTLGALDSTSWEIQPDLALDPGVRDDLQQAFIAGGFASALEWDATKQVMVSVESRHELEIPQTQAALDRWFGTADAIARSNHSACHRTAYSVDVQRRELTKAAGAEFGLANFGKGASREVVVFGDSAGDAAMAEVAMRAEGPGVRFIWLGRGEAPALDGVAIETAPEPFWRGTARVLDRWT